MTAPSTSSSPPSPITAPLTPPEGWSQQGQTLTRTWRFEGDEAPLAWVNRVWALAQARQHHPDVELSYGRVTLHLTTHDAGVLTNKDITLALELNALALTHTR